MAEPYSNACNHLLPTFILCALVSANAGLNTVAQSMSIAIVSSKTMKMNQPSVVCLSGRVYRVFTVLL